MKEELYDFGMVGLGVMGSNLLLNMADHGYGVVGFDLSVDKTKSFEASSKGSQRLKGVNSLQDMVRNLKTPRKIMMLVPAGKPVDSVINQIKPLLSKGDVLIDGGNSHYTDTIARIGALKDSGIHFMGVGISGGEEGARFGPSIMPGGDKEAYNSVSEILKAISAKVNGEPCVGYMGKGAAGHYVKMVHNGIEYAIMQLISETYDILKHGLGYSNKELGATYKKWDRGEMKSFLLEITGKIFGVKDADTGKDLVDLISDKAGAKGTGKWTSQSGLDLPMPVPNIDVAVMMRNLSSLLDERKEASQLFKFQLNQINTGRENLENNLHDALYFAMVICYAQGLAMMTTASKELQMDIQMTEAVKSWRGGCIIRSGFLGVFSKCYEENPQLKNILLNKEIAASIEQKLSSIQKVISIAAENNYAVPGLMSAYCYFNAYSRKSLPTNLVQAQRDFFGAHTYQRIDKEGVFHTVWESVK